MSLTLYYGHTSYTMDGAKLDKVTYSPIKQKVTVKLKCTKLYRGRSATMTLDMLDAELLAYKLLASVAQIKATAVEEAA